MKEVKKREDEREDQETKRDREFFFFSKSLRTLKPAR